MTSYIGSEAGSDHGSVIVDNTMITKLIINDLPDLPNKRMAIDYDTPACAAIAEPEVTQSAACAATVEHVPSLRRAVETEIYATAKAKMAKDNKAAKKKPAKLSGHLPLCDAFIEKYQKKDGDKDSGDIVV